MKATDSPSVIIMAHIFPPASLVGALRPAKFAKYLGRCGWRVTVVTTRKAPYGFDESLMHDLVDVRVERTRSLETFELRALLSEASGRSVLGRFAGRALRVLQSVAIPDHAAGWIPFAYAAALRAARTALPDVVLATGNPFSVFVAGTLVSARLRLPLVLDYRDPWTLQANYSPRPMNKLFSRWFERMATKRAAGILVVNDEMKAHMREVFGSAVADKTYVLANGYDEEELSEWRPQLPAERLLLMHVGSFTSRRPPDPLWDLLFRIPEGVRAQIDVVLLGADGVSVPPELESTVRVLPRLPREAALEEMSKAHVLLVVTGSYASEQTTKLLDYLGMGAPVLVLGQKRSSAASLVADSGAGVGATTEDMHSALSFVIENLERVRRGEPPSPQYVRPRAYSRQEQVGHLSQILSEVSGRSMGGGPCSSCQSGSETNRV